MSKSKRSEQTSCGKSVEAAQAAIKAHEQSLLIEGGPATQLWHLIASLHEWCAVQGVSFDAALKAFKDANKANELNLPATRRAEEQSGSNADTELKLLEGPEVVYPANAEGGLYMQIVRDRKTPLSAYTGQLQELATKHGYAPFGRVKVGMPSQHGIGTVTHSIWFHDKAK